MPPATPARPLRIPETEGWTHTRCLRLLGFDVAVWSDDPTVVRLVDELYASTAVSDAAAAHALFIGRHRADGRSGFFAALDGNVIVRTPARSIAFAHALFEANQQAIEHTPGLIRIHAAAAVVGERAVVLPGPMGTGKSTLVAGLVDRGAGYLTDEVGALDPEHRTVHPYAKPLSIGEAPAPLDVHWEPDLESGCTWEAAASFRWQR